MALIALMAKLARRPAPASVLENMLRIGRESGRGMASRGDEKWRRKEGEKGQTTEDKRTNASDGGRAIERVNERMWVVLEERLFTKGREFKGCFSAQDGK
jgi:hypothetical protein